MTDVWAQEARKIGGDNFVQVIEEIRDNQRVMSEGQEEIIRRLDMMDDKHDASERSIAVLNRAFANSDPEGHRRYHEIQIEILAEKRKLTAAVKEKTISGLVWLIIIGAGSTIWNALRTAVR